jgi:hypothetical protein
MGTLHTLLKPELVERLEGQFGKDNKVVVLTKSDFGDGRIFVLLSSPRLTEEYHGYQDLIIENGKVRFRSEGTYHEDS